MEVQATGALVDMKANHDDASYHSFLGKRIF